MAQDLSRLPTALYTQQQVREAELLAVSQGAATLYELVERAGYAAFQYLAKHIATEHGTASTPLLMLVGSGNNGADALVCARLALEAGNTVSVMLTKTTGSVEYERALTAYVNQGGLTQEIDINLISQAEIIVDGLLGTGVKGEVRDDTAKLINAINQSTAWVLSLDLPSGINPDTGAVANVAVMADVTLCFGGSSKVYLPVKLGIIVDLSSLPN